MSVNMCFRHSSGECGLRSICSLVFGMVPIARITVRGDYSFSLGVFPRIPSDDFRLRCLFPQSHLVNPGSLLRKVSPDYVEQGRAN